MHSNQQPQPIQYTGTSTAVIVYTQVLGKGCAQFPVRFNAGHCCAAMHHITADNPLNSSMNGTACVGSWTPRDQVHPNHLKFPAVDWEVERLGGGEEGRLGGLGGGEVGRRGGWEARRLGRRGGWEEGRLGG